MEKQPKLVDKKEKVQVAAGIIRNKFGQIYLTRRLEGQDFAQLLEFPGGKIEKNETPMQALTRELEEEIGIHILDLSLYEHFSFEYSTKTIEFFFFLVEEWVGNPVGCEGQDGFWIEQEVLDESVFPPANTQLIKRLKLELMT